MKMKATSDYDQETRIDAMTTIVAALLSLENDKSKKSKLAIAVLGHDPR